MSRFTDTPRQLLDEIAALKAERDWLEAIIKRALYIIDYNPNALVSEVGADIRRALDKTGTSVKMGP